MSNIDFQNGFIAGVVSKSKLPSGTQTNVQADYAENDSTRAGYIHNRPMYLESVENILTQDRQMAVSTTPSGGEFDASTFANLEVGHEYTITMTATPLIDTGSVITETLKVPCYSLSASLFGAAGECPSIAIINHTRSGDIYDYRDAGYKFAIGNRFHLIIINGLSAKGYSGPFAYDPTKCRVACMVLDDTGSFSLDYDVSITIKETVDSLIVDEKYLDVMQGDYNETDENSPSYVKNKPFGCTNVGTTLVQDKELVLATGFDWEDSLKFAELELGRTYTVILKVVEAGANPVEITVPDVLCVDVKSAFNFSDVTPGIAICPSDLGAELDGMGIAWTLNENFTFLVMNTSDTAAMTLFMLFDSDGAPVTDVQAFATIQIESAFAVNPDYLHLFQGNYGETDPDSPNFIKNKPFGDDVFVTPVGEIYADADNLVMENQFYQLEHSLGIQVDNIYPIKLYTGDSLYTTLETHALDVNLLDPNVPAGIVALCVLKANGTLDIIAGLDNAAYDSVNHTFVYSDTHCLIANGNLLTNYNPTITKVVIEGLPDATYNRHVARKISTKYIDTDLKFDKYSTKPQSGMAVAEACSQIVDQMPNTVITKVEAPSTLGDQHIKVVNGGGSSYTNPGEQYLNIYTEGIGLNSDLETDYKTTLIGAINENKRNIDSVNQAIDDINNYHASILPTDEYLLELKTSSSANYIYTRDGQMHIQPVSDQFIADDELPSVAFTSDLANVQRCITARTPDGIVIYDIDKYLFYMYGHNGLQIIADYSGLSNDDKQLINDEFQTYNQYARYAKLVVMKDSGGEYVFIIIVQRGVYTHTANVIRLANNSITKTQRSWTLEHYPGENDNHHYYYNDIYLTTAIEGNTTNYWCSNSAYTDTTNTTNHRGSLSYYGFDFTGSSSDKFIYTFGDDTHNNAFSRWNHDVDCPLTVLRALDSNGVEQLHIIAQDQIYEYSGICNETFTTMTMINTDMFLCYTSDCRAIVRSFHDGSIINTIEINNDSISSIKSPYIVVVNNDLYIMEYLYAYQTYSLYRVTNFLHPDMNVVSICTGTFPPTRCTDELGISYLNHCIVLMGADPLYPARCAQILIKRPLHKYIAADNEFNPTSENAQSGVAIAAYVDEKLGELNALLDNIIAIQESLIGGAEQ